MIRIILFLVLIALAGAGVLLVAAWRVAGYLGADYLLLPRPGVRLKLRAVRPPGSTA